MDAFIAFVLCISCAAFVSCGSESTTGSTKYTAQIVNAQTNVSVTCSEPFTLKCTMKPSNASCVWSRNGIGVIQDDKRYCFNSTINDSDCLVCFFSVHEATDIDRGNWTCGMQASDSHDGMKSKNISVDVRPSNVSGTQCIDTGSKIEDNSVKNTSAAGNKDAQMIYLYIGIGLSSGIILILTSATIYLKCRNKNLIKVNSEKENQRTLSPIYEEIAENTTPVSATEASVQPSSSNLQVCPSPPPKAHKKQTSVRTKEILDWEGYQVPVKQDGALIIRDGILIFQSHFAQQSSEGDGVIELTSVRRPLPEPARTQHTTKRSLRSKPKVPSNAINTKFHSYENVNEMKSKNALACTPKT